MYCGMAVTFSLIKSAAVKERSGFFVVAIIGHLPERRTRFGFSFRPLFCKPHASPSQLRKRTDTKPKC
jgi:hypothetical protein